MTAGFLGALLARAEKTPHHVQITLEKPGESKDLTCQALVVDAQRWARVISDRGGKPGSIVLISMPLSAELIQAFLGSLWAGCIPSFMPYPSPKQDSEVFWSSHDALFTRLGGGLIITRAENRAAIETFISGATMTVLTPDDARAPRPHNHKPVHRWKGSDVCCLQHSSGTTGLKKGVMLSFIQIEAQIAAYGGVLGFSPHDQVVSWLPLYHDMGFIACFLMPLATGARTVLIDPFDWLVDPLCLFDAAEKYRGTFIWLPNFAFNFLANAAGSDERRRDLSMIRGIIDCSETCQAASLDLFQARFEPWGLAPDRILTCYAMAETVFAVSQSTPAEPPLRIVLDRESLETGRVAPVPDGTNGSIELVSSGRPLSAVEIVFFDQNGRPSPPDMTGDIAIKAPFLFGGYYLDTERTASAFRDGFYLTGDIGFQRDGHIFVLGRRDDILILLGKNVFATEIENLTGTVGGIKPGRVCAIGVYNGNIGSQELIILAETEASAPDAQALKHGIRCQLESILGIVPKKVLFVSNGWLVKSTSGKLNRAENYKKYMKLTRDAAGPASNLELQVPGTGP